MSKTFKSITILSIILLSGLALTAHAGSEHNTSGWAWSSNIGWISFNSTNESTGANYGVNIDNSGNLSGWAWSSNIGWISFDRSTTGNPPTTPLNSGSGPIAKYDSNTGKVIGWMRVLAHDNGWDGWVKLHDVSINSGGDWSGWGWSNVVVGWVSFSNVFSSHSSNSRL